MSSSSVTGVRSWRTAFLTLRDETLNSPPPTAVLGLLRNLVLSHPHDALLAAASHLPSHEVTLDLVLLAELASAVSGCPGVDDTLVAICHLIYDVSCRIQTEVNSSSWKTILIFLEKLVNSLLGDVDKRRALLSNPVGLGSIMEVFEILRFFVKSHGRNSSVSESTQLIKLLIRIISCLPMELLISPHSNTPPWSMNEVGIKNFKWQTLLEALLFAFTVIGDTLSSMGSFASVDLWQCTLEVLRKVMDIIASKSLLIETLTMSRFYAAALASLHLVLSEPKGSLSEHVAGFVAAFQMFIMYGLSSRPSLFPANTGLKSAFGSSSVKTESEDCRKNGPYRPPHLRKNAGGIHTTVARRAPNDSIKCGFTSSDSEQSDSDGYSKDDDKFGSSKARVAAMVCIQDLCRADPKSFTSLLIMLLPTNDVLQPWKNQATIMTSLLFDPVMKVRISSASTLASILDGHSSTFSQISEYKESMKCGSFTTLSSSLGQILMQVHRGVLYLIQHETYNGLLLSLFKVLMLLISATPYSRMPGELLPSVIASIRTRIVELNVSKSDQLNMMASAFSCLGSALSTSPPSLHVLGMLKEELPDDFTRNCGNSSVLNLLFQYSQGNCHPNIRLEALQALRAASHNYPHIANALWEHVSAFVLGSLQMPIPVDSSSEMAANTRRGDGRNTSGSYTERCNIAAIKVLDECLRATSGFKGIDDLLECKLLDIQSIPDCTREKRVSSAPLYELDGAANGNFLEYSSGADHWSETIEKHLPLSLNHSSPLIRAASLTCFAGLTSSVFLSLTVDNQNIIISSVLNAALNDGASSVRSAACRALGVLASFNQIFSSTKILGEFVRAAELNSHNPLVSVRITSSWALANICDSLRHRVTELHLEESDQLVESESISLLIESALRLTKDGDKIKSNAVRALGNLSRFVRFTDNPTASDYSKFSKDSFNWLERMVQAFVSCVTTGNVKVQWNVCHALGNLFINESLKLRDMPWVSSVFTILLLLLRDSTNFKIRIHAAIALAVPASKSDYGNSFSDVVQGVILILESLGSDAPMLSNIKYKDTLEKQLAFTTLHVLGYTSSEDDHILKGFFIKKASFLEEWLISLCSSFWKSLEKPNPVHEANFEMNQNDGSVTYESKKMMASKAIKSLIELYRHSNNPSLASRFEKLLDGLS